MADLPPNKIRNKLFQPEGSNDECWLCEPPYQNWPGMGFVYYSTTDRVVAFDEHVHMELRTVKVRNAQLEHAAAHG